jgi:hypothetical protein
LTMASDAEANTRGGTQRVDLNKVEVNDPDDKREPSPYGGQAYGQPNVHAATVDEAAKLDLKLNFRNVNSFDRKLLKKLVEEDLINKKNVREAMSNERKAARSIFNVNDDLEPSASAYQTSSVAFIPSPNRAQNGHIRTVPRKKSHLGGSVQKSKQTCRRSPSGQLFHELIERAKTLRDQIDTSKTADELELQKKLEKEILTANK